VESLRRGAGFLTDGRAEAAVAEFDRVATSIPLLADWADVLAARALAGAGDVTGARSRAARAGIDGAGEWAWRAEYAALILTADSSAALLLAERAAEVSSTAAERAYASARAGTLRAARQDETGALAAFRAAMQAAPGAQGALDAARGAANLSNLTPDDQLLVGRTLLANDGRDRGIPLLEAYASSPGVSAADRAAVRLEAGRILFDARDYTHAERNLRLAAEQLPAAAYQLGRTEYRLGRTAEGLKTFQRVGESFPNTAAAADAWFVLGDLAHDEGRVSEAADYYRKAITTGAHTTSAADALARLIGISLMANAPARAVADADLYFARRPVDQTSAPGVYWAGRALLAAGRRAEAEARFAEVLDVYPFSWYGSLAARRLGRTLGDLRIAPPPALTVERTRMVEAAFFRIDALREAGLTAEASLELARLRETVAADDGALYLVAEAMAAQGQSVQGALLGRQIQEHRGVWDDRLLRIVYPFPFRDDVVRYAGRNGLDPYAVAGLIRQESFFNPNAVSAAGAMGLMQVMPQTATGLARTAGIQGFRSSMLRDPTVNIRLGTLFLADQMKSWNGRLSAVLGAYNGGPTRVARWNTFPEREDDEIWVERIPLAETRDYVKRVTLYGEIYRRLYSSTN
jgi:soluble lytic murein transglycosylase